MEAILIHLLPALPPSPGIPVPKYPLWNRHPNLLFQLLQPLFDFLRTTDRRNPGKLGSDMEVVFTRLDSTNEPAIGQIRRENIEDE